MIATLLLTVAVLGAAPADSPSLGGQERSHSGILLAQADVPMPSRGFEGWTREQLQTEYNRLQESRPSLVGPIVMLSVGVALLLPGSYLLIVGLITGPQSVGLGYIFAVFGGILIIPGVILAIIGAVKLMNRLGERGEIDEKMQEIDLKLAAPGTNEAPPPPPPPPATQNLLGNDHRMILATF